MTASPSLIVLDWGTSSLRASLLGGDGKALANRIEPWGIMHLPRGDFAAAFDAVTAEWRTQSPELKAIAAGMIGSAQGWTNVPYCATPAGVEELAAALAAVPDAALYIVPGVATLGEQPNVMRGEETQIVGALEQHPELASHSLVVLPGTHSKWVRISRGKVCAFTTYMTGELFAVLRDHSILGRLASTAEPSLASEAFARGVVAAKASDQGMAPLLFTARSLVLTERLAPGACLEYLSGLLIGEELRCGLMDGAPIAALIGDAALCRRYVTALEIFGIYDVPTIDHSAQIGLWSIARRAGLASGAG